VVNTVAALVGDPNVTIHEGKAFMCQIAAGRQADALRAKLVDPARPIPHVGRRERQAAEANIDHGIELAARAQSLEELIERDPRLTLDQPMGVYYG
jgi:hypothetical protein